MDATPVLIINSRSYLTKATIIVLLTLVRMPAMLLIILLEESVTMVVRVAKEINSETTYWWDHFIVANWRKD